MPHLFAYLDLASGSTMIQAAIAGIVAAPILLRNQIRRLLGRSRPTDDSSTARRSPARPRTRGSRPRLTGRTLPRVDRDRPGDRS